MSAALLEAKAVVNETVLWRMSGFAADGFAHVADDAPLPADRRPIISVARWLRERDALNARNEPVGVAIQPGDKWEQLRSDIHRFAVIALAIPKFGDGRAFSIARLLREREGFAGEIRAFGAYIIDQVPMMRRVGFDTFETADPILRRQLAAGAWPEVANHLQPAGAHDVPAGTRPWTRRTDKTKA